jgi:TetR/AcrR family transcriptional regulator, lmrAB and yxaGH operons repressor
MRAPKISDAELFARLSLVFRDHGFEGATLARISQATGLEKPSLYHRFPGGKDDMAVAVLRHVGELFASEILAPLSAGGPLETRLRRTAAKIRAFYENGQRACLLDTLSIATATPTLRRELASAYLAWQNAFAAAARESGATPAAATRRAQEAIIKIHGALVLARATGDQAPFQRAIAQLPAQLLERSP